MDRPTVSIAPQAAPALDSRSDPGHSSPAKGGRVADTKLLQQWQKSGVDTLGGFWSIDRPFGVEIMYAVLETGSKQYRVAAGDTVQVERLAVKAGEAVTFDRVLLVNNDGKVAVGSPTVASATVVGDVVEHIRGEKTVAFKMKRRKGYHKTIGHRQELTVVKIKEIKVQ